MLLIYPGIRGLMATGSIRGARKNIFAIALKLFQLSLLLFCSGFDLGYGLFNLLQARRARANF